MHKNIVNFTLGRVLYVPDLCSNLLSVSAIIKSGKPVVFENGMCYIKERGVVVAAGSYRDGLWKLDIKKKVASFATIGLNVWHRRLGHLSVGYMKKLSGKIVKIDENSECVTCSVRKIE